MSFSLPKSKRKGRTVFDVSAPECLPVEFSSAPREFLPTQYIGVIEAAPPKRRRVCSGSPSAVRISITKPTGHRLSKWPLWPTLPSNLFPHGTPQQHDASLRTTPTKREMDFRCYFCDGGHSHLLATSVMFCWQSLERQKGDPFGPPSVHWLTMSKETVSRPGHR